ncbi:hypothetical protein JYT51_01555 [Candidatus Amoebophilus asiaticus]|nr:hypothetical protein [Candidatus Amoebophilus asiaticus]
MTQDLNDIVKKIDKGIKEAIKKTILDHKRTGHSIVISRNGKIIEIPPAQIKTS